MTDPTPTRAEVEALVERLKYNAEITDYLEDREAMNQAADLIQALRERAEAAEKESAEWRDQALRKADALTAARRAEAAAWNDAIEIERELIAAYVGAVPQVVTDRQEIMSAIERGTCLQHPYMVEHHSDRIRALRRAAPTEGEA